MLFFGELPGEYTNQTFSGRRNPNSGDDYKLVRCVLVMQKLQRFGALVEHSSCRETPADRPDNQDRGRISAFISISVWVPISRLMGREAAAASVPKMIACGNSFRRHVCSIRNNTPAADFQPEAPSATLLPEQSSRGHFLPWTLNPFGDFCQRLGVATHDQHRS